MATREVRPVIEEPLALVSRRTTRARRSPVRANGQPANRSRPNAFTPRAQPPAAGGGRWARDELVVSAVVPAYNEEDLLAASVTELVTGLRTRRLPFEVIVVENGSADGTLPLAHSLATAMPEVVVVSLSDADYGKALRTGLLEARGTFVANFDADFFDLAFLDAALAGLAVPDGPSIVVGTKRGPGSVDTRAWPRRLVTAVFSTVLRAGFGLGVSDTHGMKVMRRADVVDLAAECQLGTDLFDTELILRAERAGRVAIEMPVTVLELRPARSSMLRRVPRTIRNLARLRLLLWKERAGEEHRARGPVAVVDSTRS